MTHITSSISPINICIPMHVCDRNKFEWQFSGQLTFSNTHGRLLIEFID